MGTGVAFASSISTLLAPCAENPRPWQAVVYTPVLMLVVFLLFRIPSIWEGVNFDKMSNRTAGGAAVIILGILTLTIHHTMTSTHTEGGVNSTDAFNMGLIIAGIGLLIFGKGILPRVDKVWADRLRVQTQSM